MDEEKLFEAVTKDDRDALKKMMDDGVDLNHWGDGWLGPPITLAVNEGNNEMSRFLIDAGVELPDDLLSTAVYANKMYSVRDKEMMVWLVHHLVLEKKVDVNYPPYPPLHLANAEMAGFLIENGADVNLRDEDGQTALHAAARFGAVEMIRLLVEHGADVHARDNLGGTPLDAAKGGWQSPEALRLLQELSGVEAPPPEQVLRNFDWKAFEETLVGATKRALDELAEEFEGDGETLGGFCFDCNIQEGSVLMCLGTEEELADEDLAIAWNPGEWSYQEFASFDESPMLRDFANALEEVDDALADDDAYDAFVDEVSGQGLTAICRAALRLERENAFRKLPLAQGFTVFAIDHDEGYEAAAERMQRARGLEAG